MSNEELICAWMEPRPADRTRASDSAAGFSWWRISRFGSTWDPRELDLDALHEVEARLTDEQRQHYCVLMFHACCTEARTANPIEMMLAYNRWPLLHATAAQKIKTLAAVMRAIPTERG